MDVLEVQAYEDALLSAGVLYPSQPFFLTVASDGSGVRRNQIYTNHVISFCRWSGFLLHVITT